jgi:hypothetical protein
MKLLLIIAAKADPKKANSARSSLTRALRRLRARGLISGNIRLTAQGITVAKELAR